MCVCVESQRERLHGCVEHLGASGIRREDARSLAPPLSRGNKEGTTCHCCAWQPRNSQGGWEMRLRLRGALKCVCLSAAFSLVWYISFHRTEGESNENRGWELCYKVPNCARLETSFARIFSPPLEWRTPGEAQLSALQH